MVLSLFKNVFLTLLTVFGMFVMPLFGWTADKDIIILHTNDIHCGIEDNLGFARLSQYKKDLQKHSYVALVDAGDAIQGAPLGKLSEGSAVISIMNQVGYDFAIPGNHEFDYGMKRFLQLAPTMKCGYYSANIIDLRSRKNLLPAYKIMDFGGTKIAFIGATTPETLTTSTPTFFQNEEGRYVYGFCEDKSGKKLYKQIQKNIDAVKKAGAEYVFLVGHLGIDGSPKHWSSVAVAANTKGLTAVIDGHSHERIVDLVVRDKAGRDVIIAQTGSKLKTIGKINIAADGSVTSSLVKELGEKNKDTVAIIDNEKSIYEPLLQVTIGEALVKLHTNDPATGLRMVRSREVNLANFVADAFRAVLGCDVVLVNGGSIRNEINKGVFSYKDILEAFPFGNMCTVVEVTGQQILDGLEMGASVYPEENGGFMHVSGITYTIDSSVPSGVVTDERGNFVRVSGEYRVKDVLVNGEPLDLERNYKVGGTSYVLKSGGDGIAMFKTGKLLQDAAISDADAIIEYVQNHLNGKIGEAYKDPYGEGRITIK